MTEKKSIKPDNAVLDASDDAAAQAFLAEQLKQVEQKLQALPPNANAVDCANLLLEKANAQLGLGQSEAAWNTAREAFDVFVQYEQWPQAVEASDILYQCDQPASIKALAHGIWLSVTYPIDPEHSIVMLNYMIDETPAKSDGAAVAAVTAHYIVGLRSDNDEKHDSLSFLTTNLIAKVAQRHSDVKTQEALDFWMDKLQLKDPAVFLPRMGMVLNAIVEDDQWWFDRDALRAKLPVN